MTRNADNTQERRSKRRFPIKLEVRYAILGRGASEPGGAGQTSDVSSKGIGFTADRPLRVDAPVEIVMRWPVVLENGCPLLLVATGRSVRSKGKWVACRIHKFEFRTAARENVAARALSASAGG
ncbi:MAG TPA: PilZ domain-containing protein [Bryobacteraceae bacterium]|nr:PilZ domain-containing protein [Bryobacteraceae bacterium]